MQLHFDSKHDLFSGEVCRECYTSMSQEERMVLEHRLGDHSLCQGHPDFPASELQYESPLLHDQRKAEWRHDHGDHSLCKKEYYLGCTAEEKAELMALEQRNQQFGAALVVSNQVSISNMEPKPKSQTQPPPMAVQVQAQPSAPPQAPQPQAQTQVPHPQAPQLQAQTQAPQPQAQTHPVAAAVVDDGTGVGFIP